MKVPSLEQLRAMSDAELLRLRTEISYDNSVMEGQRIAFEEKDEDWERRVGIAAQLHQRGLAAIRNILAERGAEHKEDRTVPLLPWMTALLSVAQAARLILDDDSDEHWAALERAVEVLENYGVSESFVRDVEIQ